MTVLRPAFRMRLRSHLVTLVLAALVPAILFAAFVVGLLADHERQAIERGVGETARALSIAVDRELESSVLALQALGASDYLDTGDLARFRKQALRLLATHDWSTIVLFDAPSGRQLFNLIAPSGPYGRADTVAVVMAQRRPIVSGMFRGRITGDWILAIDIPVIRGDTVRYVLGAVFRPRTLGDVLVQQRVPPGWVAVIVDQAGRVVARVPEREDAVGHAAPATMIEHSRDAREGTFRRVDEDGERRYVAFSRAENAGWTVALSAPVRGIESGVRRSMVIVGGGGLLLLLAGVGLAALIGRRIAAPITSLSDSAAALGRGDTIRGHAPSSIAEVDRLAAALDEAGTLLRQRALDRDRVETALRRSEQRYREIVETSSEGISIVDAEGRITYANQRMVEMLGYPMEDLLGRFYWDLVDETDRAEARRRFENRRQGIREQYDVRCRRRDGADVWVIVSTNPIVDEQGTFVGGLAMLTDITERKHAEAARLAVDTRMQTILENSPAVVYLKDTAGRYVVVNRRFHELFGVRAEEILGRADAEILPGAVAARLRENDRRVLAQQAPIEFEEVVMRAGERRIYLSVKFPLRDPAGRVAGVGGISTDITERKRAEEDLAHLLTREQRAHEEAELARARLAFLAEASTILALSLDYRTTLKNLAELAVPRLADWCAVDVVEEGGAVSRLAVAHVDANKTEIAEWLHQAAPVDDAAPYGIGSVLRTGRSEFHPEVPGAMLVAAARGDAERVRQLEEVHVRSVMIVPLEARERVLGTVTFATSQSGRRYDAPDLVLAEELARRAALAIDNARLFGEIEAANRGKDQFLAMLAHELRNPLAPILNALQVLDRIGTRDTPAERLRTIIGRQTRRIARLVDDLLDVARIKSGKVALQRQLVDLNEVVRRSVQSLHDSGKAGNRAVDVTLASTAVVVDGDPVRLEQVISNLLDNAVKYSAPNDPIDVRVRREGDWADVTVRDQGIGVEREMLGRIFDLFTQADRTLDRSRGGLGLGLTLVKSLVEQHGGSVAAESAGLGHGSEFTIRLPLAAGEVTDRGTAPVVHPSPRTILVVEDNPDAREALRALLELGGHRVDTADDGLRALGLALERRPDVALIDIGLPGMNGYELARRLRAGPLGESLVLIALTGYGQPDDRRQAMEAGFDAHLVKPVDADALDRVLAEIRRQG